MHTTIQRCPLTTAAIWVSTCGAFLLVSCKYLPWGKEPDQAKTCLAEPSELKSKKFGVSMEMESRVQATLLATKYLEKLAKSADDEAGKACRGLLAGLGADEPPPAPESGDGKGAEMACGRAVERITVLREKVHEALAVETVPMRCTLPVDSYADCARSCDPSVGHDNSKVICEDGTESGRCGGKCTGQCFTSFGECKGSCYARCSGKCSDEFVGTCGGKCDGTCDGESVTRKICKGKCEGKCSADASGQCGGECTGKCGGECLMDMTEKAGKCAGTCVGICSEEMTRLRCGGVIFPPEMGTECLARCQAEYIDKLQCEGAAVKAEVYGTADEEAADKLTKTIPEHLKPLLKLQDGLRPQVESALERTDKALEGIIASISEDASVRQKVGGCLTEARDSLAVSTAAFERSFEAADKTIKAVKH